MSFLQSFFTIIANHWEMIAGLIGFLFPTTGIGIYLNRRLKAQSEVRENELVAYAPPEKAKAIKETKIKKQKQDFIAFIINLIVAIGFVLFVNYTLNKSLDRAILAQELEFIKQLLLIQVCFNIAVATVFIVKVASSVTSFETFLSYIPLVKRSSKTK